MRERGTVWYCMVLYGNVWYGTWYGTAAVYGGRGMVVWWCGTDTEMEMEMEMEMR